MNIHKIRQHFKRGAVIHQNKYPEFNLQKYVFNGKSYYWTFDVRWYHFKFLTIRSLFLIDNERLINIIPQRNSIHFNFYLQHKYISGDMQFILSEFEMMDEKIYK